MKITKTRILAIGLCLIILALLSAWTKTELTPKNVKQDKNTEIAIEYINNKQNSILTVNIPPISKKSIKISNNVNGDTNQTLESFSIPDELMDTNAPPELYHERLQQFRSEVDKTIEDELKRILKK